jgi:hypothetical protein
MNESLGHAFSPGRTDVLPRRGKTGIDSAVQKRAAGAF